MSPSKKPAQARVFNPPTELIFPGIVQYNDQEYEISQHIIAAYNGILSLGLTANIGELTHAVHTMQMFLNQHMVHRLNPYAFNNWYGDAGK